MSGFLVSARFFKRRRRKPVCFPSAAVIWILFLLPEYSSSHQRSLSLARRGLGKVFSHGDRLADTVKKRIGTGTTVFLICGRLSCVRHIILGQHQAA